MARTGRPPTPVDVDAIRRLTQQGWRMKPIADYLGVSKNVVWGAMKRNNIPRHDQHSLPGNSNPAWKGGRYLDKDGYVMIYSPDHPRQNNSGYVREHRLVMEARIGRYLEKTEVVHHLDGNRQNNEPENLRLYTKNADHLQQTLKGKVPNWTTEGRARMGASGISRPPASDETRAKMSAAQRSRTRKPHSPETREKLRQAALKRDGHPHTPESKEKIRQAALQRAAAKRAANQPESENGDDPSQ